MEKVNLNDFVIDILQDLCEIQSIVQVLKNVSFKLLETIKVNKSVYHLPFRAPLKTYFVTSF